MRPQLDTLRLDADTLAELRQRSAPEIGAPRAPLPSIPFELRKSPDVEPRPRARLQSIPFELRKSERASSAAPPKRTAGARIFWLLVLFLVMSALLVAGLVAAGAVDSTSLRGMLPLF